MRSLYLSTGLITSTLLTDVDLASHRRSRERASQRCPQRTYLVTALAVNEAVECGLQPGATHTPVQRQPQECNCSTVSTKLRMRSIERERERDERTVRKKKKQPENRIVKRKRENELYLLFVSCLERYALIVVHLFFSFSRSLHKIQISKKRAWLRGVRLATLIAR